MPSFVFASCVPFGAGGALEGGGSERTGVLFRGAAYEAPPDEVLARIEELLSLHGADSLRYADKKHGQRRAARLVRDGQDARLEAFLLAGDTRAEAWIKALLQDRLPAQAYGRQLLKPGSTAPAGVTARGKVVCSCFGVTQTAIAERLAEATGSDEGRLGALQAALKCGTNCGSCLPELKRMVRASPALATAP
jgi:assimilatory nitrate reductase catalytic subunit